MLRAIPLLLLVLAIDTVFASGRFVASSRVSADGSEQEIRIVFNCKVAIQVAEPQHNTDQIRVYLEPTTVCNGVSPVTAASRGRYRPVNADAAHLIDLEYDGESASASVLTLNFSQPVSYTLDTSAVSFNLLIRVTPAASAAVAARPPRPEVAHRRVERPKEAAPLFAVVLKSLRRVPTVADSAAVSVEPGKRTYYSEALVDGQTWYRLKLGNFDSAEEAGAALKSVQQAFPGAWINKASPEAVNIELVANPKSAHDDPGIAAPVAGAASASKVDALMAEARKIMLDSETSRAIQIYTKVLQMPPHARHPEAQELLALAREKNGQLAHAKAEYQRYLSVYPDAEGVPRVSQRLAALLAGDRQAAAPADGTANKSKTRRRSERDWRVQTFVSQYYRRDVNQQNEQDEIVSQSAMYSDVNVDARRRGERFDFSSRLSAGYRSDFLDDSSSSGKATRISYAYADLADAVTGLRARFGRQSRNTGGVLGRFDGLNVGYKVSEKMLVDAVVGKPAYSSNDGIDSARTFYGASINYSPEMEGLDLGLYFIQQDIEGINDRQAVGGEFRYFGQNQSLWGQVDYDVKYQELGNAFLQANWRFTSRLTLHGSVDKRHSPFLSAGNALIGQPVATFSELLQIFGEHDVRQLGLDRSPLSTTYSLGVSHSLTTRLQVNADINSTEVDASPDSGGVFGSPASSYKYFSANVVASSLFKEGDVTILGARYSDSDTANVVSFTLDSRYPFGRTWRINPRLRVDRRERLGDVDYEWIYTPGIRMQYRRSQKLRIDLEAGKQFSQRQVSEADLDRESYFINIGYQLFF
jgi:tetratricopeptide (TPR) repeat protein